MESFKIWCETNEERDAVLKKLEKNGYRWLLEPDTKLTDYVKDVRTPTALYLDNNRITFGVSTTVFKKNSGREIKVEEFLGKNKKQEIHITVDGNNVHAIMKKDGKVIKRAVAKCSPEDKFDFKIGSRLAMERLLSGNKTKGVIVHAIHNGKGLQSIINCTKDDMLASVKSLMDDIFN